MDGKAGSYAEGFGKPLGPPGFLSNLSIHLKG
jgi:hypothetical protein